MSAEPNALHPAPEPEPTTPATGLRRRGRAWPHYVLEVVLVVLAVAVAVIVATHSFPHPSF